MYYVHAVTIEMVSGDKQGIILLEKSKEMIPEINLINKFRVQYNNVIAVKYEFVMQQSSYQRLITKD